MHVHEGMNNIQHHQIYILTYATMGLSVCFRENDYVIVAMETVRVTNRFKNKVVTRFKILTCVSRTIIERWYSHSMTANDLMKVHAYMTVINE